MERRLCRLNLFNMERNTVTIDATDRILGRLATEVAKILMGKHKATYLPNIDGGDIVKIENIRQMKVTGKKMEDKIYYHHTMHPGHLQERTMREVWEEDPAEVLKKAVKNMMPKNRLHTDRMLRLIIS